MKKKPAKYDPSNGTRKDWQNDIEDEITTLLEELDYLELSKETMTEIEKYVDRFKLRVNERIEQFTITPDMVAAQEGLFEDILWNCYCDKFTCGESDIDRMIDIVSQNRGGEFVKAETIPEQIRLEEFIASLTANPYQLQLIA